MSILSYVLVVASLVSPRVPDTVYDQFQQASSGQSSAARDVSSAFQKLLSGEIRSRTGPLPGRALAGTKPDCPGGLFTDHESKAGNQNKEEIIFDPDFQRKLIAGGYLCEPVDPRLRDTIVGGVIIQEVQNAEKNVGPWTDENVKKWERNGHSANKAFMQAVLETPELITNPDSRRKLAKRIADYCKLIDDLR
jgi:hypothetical protein